MTAPFAGGDAGARPGSGFRGATREQLARPLLREALARATDHTNQQREACFAGTDLDQLRRRGEQLRRHAVAHLDELAEGFRARCRERGTVVHDARTAAEARAIVLDVLARAGARRVVKSKSMVSEEVHLNPALAAAGLEVVETDLGEYVVQLDHDRPSHLIAPIIHRTRAEVREILARGARADLPEDPAGLTAHVRARLRPAFLDADAGITGANFAIAETGSLCLVTNEGNGRLATSLPPLHIALVGVERLTPHLTDLAVLLPLLTGAGTGQRLTSYVSMLHGPRRAGEPDGPAAMHVVLVDAGRRALARTPYASALQCIRCGACQNVCPVFRQVGGHAYPWVYGGPIGAVVTPLLRSDRAAPHLADASTLCAACDDVCPVRIPLHALLLGLRARRRAGLGERAAFSIWSWAWSRPGGYALSARLAGGALRLLARGGRVRSGPGPLGRWTLGHDLAPPPAPPFHRRGGGRSRPGAGAAGGSDSPTPAGGPEALAAPPGGGPIAPGPPTLLRPSPAELSRGRAPLEAFRTEAEAIGCRVIRTVPGELAEVVARVAIDGWGAVALADRGTATTRPPRVLLAADLDAPDRERIREALARAGCTCVDVGPASGAGAARGAIDVSITGCVAAIAATGSVVVSSRGGRAAGVIAPLHVCVVPAGRVVPGLADGLGRAGDPELGSQVAIQTGPSSTADIEKVLVRGMHGPVLVQLVVVG